MSAVADDRDVVWDGIDFLLGLGSLTEKERIVLHRVYWRDQGLADIGRDLGLSRERIRQIHDRAIAKMRGTCRAVAA